MKILHTADWHLGKYLEGNSRIEEQEQFLEDFIKMADDRDVDLVMVAGDVYDQVNPPYTAEKLLYDTLKKLTNGGKRLVLLIAGNHDSPDRLVAARPLAQEHGIIMVGTPSTVVEVGQYGQHKVVQSAEGMIEVEINGERAVILAVPYPSEKRLNEVLYRDMADDEEKLQSYNDRIQLLFNNLEQYYREDTINLVVTHLFSSGAEKEGTERSIELGGAYILDSKCFPEKAQYIAMGHIHKPQIIPGSNGKVRYSGSPIHYNKTEIRYEKKCLYVEVEAGSDATITEIPVPVYKPIEVWKCKSIEETLQMCEAKKAENSWVYLEIESDRTIREDEIKEMKALKADILSIHLNLEGEKEEDIEMAQDLSFEELFKLYYKEQKAVEPAEEVLELLYSIMEGDADETNLS